MTLANSKSQTYSKQGLGSLFLMCAFPLHFWTLLLAFGDISWLTERSNFWDAIGVVSYGMVFAFIESGIVFMVAVLLGFLVPRRWKDRRAALLGILVLITALWGMAGQLYFPLKIPLPEQIIQVLVHSAHPVRVIYLALLPVVFLTVAVPTYFILQSDRIFKIVQDFIERVTLLTMFYLFLSFIGLVIVIVRNMP
jgi:hypothetical protein